MAAGLSASMAPSPCSVANAMVNRVKKVKTTIATNDSNAKRNPAAKADRGPRDQTEQCAGQNHRAEVARLEERAHGDRPAVSEVESAGEEPGLHENAEDERHDGQDQRAAGVQARRERRAVVAVVLRWCRPWRHRAGRTPAMHDHTDHSVDQRREDQRPKVRSELIPRPAERVTDAEPLPGRRWVARRRPVAGRRGVVRLRRPVAGRRRGIAGRRPVTRLRRPIAGRRRGRAIPRGRSIARAAREVVRSRAAVREEGRSQVADSRLGWDYRPKDRSGCQGAPEVGSLPLLPSSSGVVQACATANLASIRQPRCDLTLRVDVSR